MTTALRGVHLPDQMGRDFALDEMVAHPHQGRRPAEVWLSEGA